MPPNFQNTIDPEGTGGGSDTTGVPDPQEDAPATQDRRRDEEGFERQGIQVDDEGAAMTDRQRQRLARRNETVDPENIDMFAEQGRDGMPALPDVETEQTQDMGPVGTESAPARGQQDLAATVEGRADTRGPAAGAQRGEQVIETSIDNPGRAAVAAAPAAATEPSPVGEIVVAGLAGLAVANAATRGAPPELPVPEDTGLPTTDLGVSIGGLFPEEIREPQGPAATMTEPELPATGSGIPETELPVRGPTQIRGPEIPISRETPAGGTPAQATDQTVVPEEFPLPGRDLPARPDQEFISPDRTPPMTDVSQQLRGRQRQRRDQSTRDGVRQPTGPSDEELAEILSGGGTLGEIEDDPTGPRIRRDFPTGGSAVVGGATGEAAAEGIGTLVEEAQRPQATVGGQGRTIDPTLGAAGVGATAAGLRETAMAQSVAADDVVRTLEGTDTETRAITETAADTATETVADTATATETAAATEPALAAEPGFETPPAAEPAFPTEPAAATETVTEPLPEQQARSRFDPGDDGDRRPDEEFVDPGFTEEQFTREIAGGPAFFGLDFGGDGDG